MKKTLRKAIAIALCFNMLTGIFMSVSADSSNSLALEANVFTGSELMEKGANNIFNINNKASRVLSTQEDNIEYDVDISDNNDGTAEINLEGIFYVNGIRTEFEAFNDRIRKVEMEDNKILYFGTLEGTCTIDEVERHINVSFEKTEDNIYLAFVINKLNTEEGIALIQFGKSILTDEIYNDLFKNKNNNGISPRVNYTYVDGDWEEIEDNETRSLVIRGEMYLEQRLVRGYDSGRILTRWQYDSNDLLRELAVSQSEYRFEDIECSTLVVTYSSDDRESYFGGHHPDTGDSNRSIAQWVANALSDIGMPSYGLSTLISLISDGTDDVSVSYANDLYRRRFRVYLYDEEFMDWYYDRDGGFTVEVAVESPYSTDDDISVTGYMELGFRMYDKYTNNYVGWASLYTQDVILSDDLASYK